MKISFEEKGQLIYSDEIGDVDMCVVSINVPEEILLALHEDKSGFAEYMKRMVALDLYKNKKVTLGYCASVAEMTKEEFVKNLGMNGISIFSFTSENEFLTELANAEGGVNIMSPIALSHIINI